FASGVCAMVGELSRATGIDGGVLRASVGELSRATGIDGGVARAGGGELGERVTGIEGGVLRAGGGELGVRAGLLVVLRAITCGCGVRLRSMCSASAECVTSRVSSPAP